MKFLSLLILALPSSALSQKIYQGFNTGAFSGTDTAKTQSDFEKEFLAASSLHYSPGIFSSARLYTCVQHKTTNTPIAAFQAAINTNTSLLLGIWCSGTSSIENELSALKSAISQYGDKFTSLVMGMSVGSEDLHRASEVGAAKNAGVGAGPDTIVGFVKEVRSALAGTALSGVPIGHVDSWVAWTNSSNAAVVDEVDFLGMDMYPYYEDKIGNSIENATNVFEDLHNRTLKVAGQKPVWITETGWPTSGDTVNQAVPSVANAKVYWDAIACKYVGHVNTWWYDLQDANPAIAEKFAISKDLTADTVFNLSCPADSGAPAAVNTDLSKGVAKLNAGAVQDVLSVRNSAIYVSLGVLYGLGWLL